MIYSSSLTEETQKFASLLEEAGDRARAEISEDLKKVSNTIYENMMENLESWFSDHIQENFKLQVAHEVRHLLSNLLNGNLEVIKDICLLSDYTFDNLHEIRLAIWRAAGQDVEGSIIREQKKQIDELTKEIENLRKWR